MERIINVNIQHLMELLKQVQTVYNVCDIVVNERENTIQFEGIEEGSEEEEQKPPSKPLSTDDIERLLD